jgi:hypothetical protein
MAADQDQEQYRNDNGATRWNEFNELTLSVMANRNKYDKCKKSLANTTDALNEAFRKEKLYYKERILNMTRDLFHEQCENETMNTAHRDYLKACIEYLKWNDITDMVNDDKRNEVRYEETDKEEHSEADILFHARDELQRKIQEGVDDNDNDNDNDDATSEEDDKFEMNDEQLLQNEMVITSPSLHKDIMSIANKMCIRKKTIDDFIILKPAVKQSDEDINARLPKVRDYHGEIMKRAISKL